MLKKIYAVLDRNAEAAAAAAHCTVQRHWVSKSKPALANHAMAEITFRNLERAGAPSYGDAAVKVAQQLQAELGLTPMAQPFADELSELVPPQEAERRLRRDLPSWQTHYTSDDYTDMTWFAPTVRFYVGRAVLKAPPGFAYPEWALNALGGIAATIDPTVETAAKTIAGTILDLMTDRAALERAQAEFRTRRETGGGPGSLVRLCPARRFPLARIRRNPARPRMVDPGHGNGPGDGAGLISCPC